MDAAPTAPHGPIWRGATVLVVDDEPPVRQLLRRTLEGEGLHVEEAQDGESALRLIQARTEPFDLVLTDLSMPQIDGRQLSESAEAVSAERRRPLHVRRSRRRAGTTRCVTPSPAPPI